MKSTEASSALLELLRPITDSVAQLDLSDPAAAKAELDAHFDVANLSELRALVRSGVEAGWLAEFENGGIRYGRVVKAGAANELGIDAVHMDKPGPGHEHPRGEVDLCFSVSGEPTFDGNPEGWTVYGPKSWHVPTVEGGVMDILYFLPGGEIRFGPKDA